jgi:hypothetical protein
MLSSLGKAVAKHKDLTAVQKIELISGIIDRLEARRRNIANLAETLVQVQESEDLAYLEAFGEAPPPEWRSPIVANLMTHLLTQAI